MATERAINGKVYSWSDIRFVLLGRSLVGVTEINYEDSEEVKRVMGRGKKSVGYTQGNYQCSGNIKLFRYEVDGIIRALGLGKSIYDLEPFDIAVVYIDDSTGLQVTDILKGVKFIKRANSASNSNTDPVMQTLDMSPSEIIWSVGV
jgi:hypothetical protein